MTLVVDSDHADQGTTTTVFPVVVGTVETLDQTLGLKVQIQGTKGTLCFEHEVTDKDTFPALILEMIDAVQFHSLLLQKNVFRST
jgi:hypothetical protein